MRKLTAAQHKALYAPVQVAKGIAVMAHEGQQYLSDPPRAYISHVQQVVNMVSMFTDDPDTLAAAWLHDVLEDTKVTVNVLREFGVSDNVIHYAAMLTRQKGRTPAERVPYFEYIKRIRGEPAARIVKLCDLAANLQAKPPESLAGRYVKALFILLNIEWLAEPSTKAGLLSDPEFLRPLSPAPTVDVAKFATPGDPAVLVAHDLIQKRDRLWEDGITEALGPKAKDIVVHLFFAALLKGPQS
jgi:hypothetical protein